MKHRHKMVWLAAACVAAWTATPAGAQTVGTFAWQTQPHCNVLTITVIQQGGLYQLTGSDNLCGAGVAPLTGTAVPSGAGVAFGVTVALPTGRAAHLSATISLGTLSGSWSDADGNSGPFVFGASITAAPRPAPAPATAITVAQLSSSVYGGTGAATTLSRSDHLHDDRYYTQSQIDGQSAARVIALGFLTSATPPVFLDARTRPGVTVTATRVGVGLVELVVDGSDTDLFPILTITPSLNGNARTCQTRSLITNTATQFTYRIGCYEAGVLADTSFMYVIVD